MPRKNSKRPQLPSALTIAGSDSGGGAGIQTDLKTFAALHVHGTSVVTCLTAQNPREVTRVLATPPSMVKAQLEAILKELPPRAIKTGMLFSAKIVESVIDALTAFQSVVIVDPVMIATSGAVLMKKDAVRLIKRELLPRADLVTPNLAEAEFLLEKPIRNLEDLRAAAREFHARFGCAALLKGGHLPGPQAIDFYNDGSTELMLESPRIAGISTHGTGCTYSAAITAFCARGMDLPQAVTQAKTFITNAIANSYSSSGHFILNTHWNLS